MKIVDRKTFLALPKNTLFAKFKRHAFGDILIKMESQGNDFYYQDLLEVDIGEYGGDMEFCNVLDRACDDGESFRLDLQCVGRDGLYDEDQLFAVFEESDVDALINRLSEAKSTFNN